MDQAQKDFLKRRRDLVIDDKVTWDKLEKKLLSIGGEAVVPMPEDDLNLLLFIGHEFNHPTRSIPGKASGCHQNVATLFQEGMLRAAATGYGLSDDGLWRQHSWGLDWKGNLVETTVPREKYFGFYMVGAAGHDFAKAQL